MLRGTSSLTTTTATTTSGALIVSASSIGEYSVVVSFSGAFQGNVATIAMNGSPVQLSSILSGDPAHLQAGTNSFVIALPHSGTNYTIGISIDNGYQGSVSFTSAIYIPGAPSIQNVATTATVITFSWSAVPNAVQYIVYLNGAAVITQPGTTAGIGGLAPNTRYTIGVQAVAPDVV